MIRPSAFSAICLAVAASLSAIGATQFAAPESTSTSPPTATPVLEPPATPKTISLNHSTDTHTRPLFSPTRRPQPKASPPPPEPKAPPPPKPPSLDHLTLTGIATARGNRIAIFRDSKRNETVSVFEGDRIEGWTVEKIEAETVTLVIGNEQKLFELWQEISNSRKRKMSQ